MSQISAFSVTKVLTQEWMTVTWWKQFLYKEESDLKPRAPPQEVMEEERWLLIKIYSQRVRESKDKVKKRRLGSILLIKIIIEIIVDL